MTLSGPENFNPEERQEYDSYIVENFQRQRSVLMNKKSSIRGGLDGLDGSGRPSLNKLPSTAVRVDVKLGRPLKGTQKQLSVAQSVGEIDETDPAEKSHSASKNASRRGKKRKGDTESGSVSQSLF